RRVNERCAKEGRRTHTRPQCVVVKLAFYSFIFFYPLTEILRLEEVESFCRAHFIAHKTPIEFWKKIKYKIFLTQIQEMFVACSRLDLHYRVDTNGERMFRVFGVTLYHHVRQVVLNPRC